jgi:hypothetical protein
LMAFAKWRQAPFWCYQIHVISSPRLPLPIKQGPGRAGSLSRAANGRSRRHPGPGCRQGLRAIAAIYRAQLACGSGCPAPWRAFRRPSRAGRQCQAIRASAGKGAPVSAIARPASRSDRPAPPAP